MKCLAVSLIFFSRRHNVVLILADMRKLDVFEKSAPEISQEQIDVFKSVAKKIKFKYHPSQFENPVLMTTYTNIEALLFDRHDLEVYDSTKPDDDRIDSKVGPFVDRIADLFGEVCINVAMTQTKIVDNDVHILIQILF